MLAFLIFLMACYGFANAVARLKAGLVVRAIAAPIPVVRFIVKCPACLAFWIGLAVSWWALSPAGPFCDARWKAMLIDGFAACAFVYLADATAEKITQGVPDF